MNSETVSTEFSLTGPGWADLVISASGKSFRMDGVSYTTDVLGDLLRLALMLATGAWTARPVLTASLANGD